MGSDAAVNARVCRRCCHLGKRGPARRQHHGARARRGEDQPPAALGAGARELLRQCAAPRHAERVDGTAIAELVEQRIGKPSETREAIRMPGKRRSPHPRHVEEHDFDIFERAGEWRERLERRAQAVECDQGWRSGAAGFHGHPQPLVTHAEHADVEVAAFAHGAPIIGDRPCKLNRRNAATIAVSAHQRLSAGAYRGRGSSTARRGIRAENATGVASPGGANRVILEGFPGFWQHAPTAAAFSPRHSQEALMAARALASVTVAFGMVSIPVKLYAATQAQAAISFNLLHKDCGSRLRQQYVCAREGVVVERADMVKGYEFAKDQYVTFTPEELKELEEKGTQTIEISEFVPAESIDPIYYDKAYFLGPDKGGAKPYALLAESMRQTGQTAVGRYAARGKQYIVQLRAVPGGLVMQQLLYAPEVRTIADVGVETAPVRDNELALAKQLISQISSEHFDPTQYEDDVRKRIEAAVQGKVEGQQIAVSPSVPEAGAQVIDLMEALRASLAKTTGKRAPKAAEPAPTEEKVAQRKPARKVAAEPAEPRRKVAKR